MTAFRMRSLAHFWFAGAVWMAAVAPAYAVSIVMNYIDPPGEGFNDVELGAARKAALEFAAGIWAQELTGSVPIVVNARMPALGGTGTTALLGSTNMTTIHSDFPNAPDPTWYGAALANEISGVDLNGPDVEEIDSEFNADVDNDIVLGSISWYYGTDGQAGTDIDFVTVALHELAHGLNFAPAVDPATGAFPSDLPGIYDWWLLRPGVGSFPAMVNAERLAAITSQSVYWSGPYVGAALGRMAPIYVPSGTEPGSSLSHWDPSLRGELMVPFYMTPTHDPGLALPALLDMGWQLASGGPTPVAWPTLTPSSVPTTTPTPAPVTRRSAPQVYVTNFDSGTVSVIDTATRRLAATIPVGDGPLSAAASPDGRFVFVANFRSGSVSILHTGTKALLGTIDLDASCYGIAAAPDNRTVYVSNTAEDTVSVIDISERRVATRIPVAHQPAGLAIDPTGLQLYVAASGAPGVDVVDTKLGAVTARLSPTSSAPLAIAFSIDGRFAYLGLSDSPSMVVLNTTTFVASAGASLLQSGYAAAVQAVAVAPSGNSLYASVEDPNSGNAFVAVLDAQSYQVISRFTAAHDPQALVLTPDGKTIYVTDASSNATVLLDSTTGSLVASVPVGETPLGSALANAPVCPGDCNGDGRVTVDELLYGVNVVLNVAPLDGCFALDPNASGVATVADLLGAVHSALNGCSD